MKALTCGGAREDPGRRGREASKHSPEIDARVEEGGEEWRVWSVGEEGVGVGEEKERVGASARFWGVGGEERRREEKGGRLELGRGGEGSLEEEG